MFLAWIINAVALIIGAYLGARGLVDPTWAARLVRLKEDEQGGGFAEFRATYGGLFLGLHLAALVFTLAWLTGRQAAPGAVAVGASAAIAAAWASAAFGRAVSIWRDRGADTRFNRISVAVETAMALCIGAPWAMWLLLG